MPEIEEVLTVTEEAHPIAIELEKISYDDIACNMALVLNNIGEIDVKMFSKTEAEKIDKARIQALKLLCHAMDELNKEHFPKTAKK